MKFSGFASAVIALAFTGCAQIIIDKGHEDERALHFFEPRPFLVVTDLRDKNGKLIGKQTNTVYLPDCSRPRSIKSKGGFGSVVFNPTLTNGWNLTGLTSTVDAQVDESIGAIVSALPVLGIAGGDGDAETAGLEGEDQLKSGFYSMNFDADSGMIASFSYIDPTDHMNTDRVSMCSNYD